MSAFVSSDATEQPGLLFLTQTIALTLDHQRVAVVQQPIEDRRGQDIVAEDGSPLRHELIRGDEQAGALVATRDQLEKEMRAAALKRQVSELVDDQQLRLRVKHQSVTELAV